MKLPIVLDSTCPHCFNEIEVTRRHESGDEVMCPHCAEIAFFYLQRKFETQRDGRRVIRRTLHLVRGAVRHR